MTEAALKPGWTKVKFGEVVRLCKDRSSDPEADGIERYVGLEHLEPEDLRIRRWGLVADGTTFTSRFKPGQVLFGKRRAYQRKVAVADFEGVCSGDIYVFESADPRYLLPELIPFICQADHFFEYAVGTSAGSLSPRTSWKHLQNFSFLLPPLEEQKNITQLFLACERFIAEAYIAIETANKLRFSTISNYLLASSWQEHSSLEDACELIVDCKNRTPPYTEESEEYPVIRTVNIKDGRLVFEDLKFTTEAGYKTWTERAVPRIGDVVMTREAPVGEACVIPKGITPCLGQRTMLFRPKKEKLNSGFLLAVLLSPLVQRELLRLAGGSTVGHVRVGDIKSLKTPLPPIQIQEEIETNFEQIRQSEIFIQQRYGACRSMKSRLIRKLLQ